ncbi:kinesin [Paenibacillus sp. P96]|uniref:Kinesin n=1 Tax=Paenibacillus zeirhizosphaerae TaxID=2987519 RepID=A0ABT9FSS3_9BACL|nr:kinesin [Paenibacillus sp. P96]MDP4097541.1 kinesin [Paenibacillus sp. P96]
MPQNEMELEKESAGGIERVLFFLIPIVFTIVLVGVLLTLFNMDFRSSLLQTANKIPLVKNWVPDPKPASEEQKAADKKAQADSSEATIKKLKSELSQQETELKQTAAAKAERDQKVQELEKQLQNAKAEQEAAAAATSEADEDPYLKQIKNLSSMYEEMSPSKAAPILSNLTNLETVQMLMYMAPENQSKILAKMDPQKAAEITMDLKNATDSSDLKVAALQARLQQEEKTTPASTGQMDDQAVGSTFASMDPGEGAELILQTYKISPEKALNILRTVDSATRSGLLEEMSRSDSAQAAKILNKLLASN